MVASSYSTVAKQRVSETQSKTALALTPDRFPEAPANSARQSQEIQGTKLREENAF